MNTHTLMEQRLQHIRDNCIVTPKDEHANFCQDHAELTLKAYNNNSTVKDKTIKQLRKKNKKLEKQIMLLKSINEDTSSSSEEEEDSSSP